MDDLNHLFGTCACSRNQYTIVIPTASTSRANVFFDNSASNRRAQAAPVTAWLRVPLEFYHSSTFSQFPDETHATIKRSFTTPSQDQNLPSTRRQFCGYCGTHLTAWNEGLHDHDTRADFIDVTLASLLNESLTKLESLGVYDSDEESEPGLVKSSGGQIDEDTHIPTNEESAEGVDGRPAIQLSSETPTRSVQHSMSGRGIPYFETMVENSRLGRIKHQKGGHTSADGTRTVQWEVTEIEGNDEEDMTDVNVAASGGTGNKRMRMGT
ncbi:hypothetical protein LTR56_004554 [Elasticomyces elasticus]|nr:hypothetical protein LTR56_004554 [Elasticomyces elasticus]KAK3659926.1 hypothetical protein LTR22_008293 [Elasticomyces elasticus]KAK4904808.1 hypothetical protein LTR49_025813 [Elasticomyces elasticus]KAK5768130.1 hypothetical protein LTS12_001614 [Elasticomyces elasticus]